MDDKSGSKSMMVWCICIIFLERIQSKLFHNLKYTSMLLNSVKPLIQGYLSRQSNCWSLRCSWRMSVGAAPTTSSFSTTHFASMDWAKTTAKWDEKHLNCVIWWLILEVWQYFWYHFSSPNWAKCPKVLWAHKLNINLNYGKTFTEVSPIRKNNWSIL